MSRLFGIKGDPQFGKPTVYVTGGVAGPREEYRLTRATLTDAAGRVVGEFVGPKRWREDPVVGSVVLGEMIEVPVAEPAVVAVLEVEVDGEEFVMRQVFEGGMSVPASVVGLHEGSVRWHRRSVDPERVLLLDERAGDG